MTASKNLLSASASGGAKLYVEDVFSTYLYTGNGTTQTITNGIDLAGEGGMVWIKSRSVATDNALYDTERGATKELVTNSFAAQTIQSTGLTAFNGAGVSIGALAKLNTNAATYASWTFRKAPKFFDVVTWTGDGSVTRNIPHNLGSTPGMVIVRTYDTANFYWVVWHRSLGQYYYLKLDQPDAQAYNSTMFKSVDASNIQVGLDGNVNSNGKTYVAYLFAHNAGGFGDDGLQDVISCGSYTGNGSATGPTITLGWEPQYVMVKQSSSTGAWYIFDSMRGFTAVGSVDKFLRAEDSAAEDGSLDYIVPTATGFQVMGTGGHTNAAQTYIYIAIRRPMKTPVSGSEVFAVDTRNGTLPSPPLYTSGFVVDAALERNVSSTGSNILASRMTGQRYLLTDSTSAELAAGAGYQFDYNDGWYDGTSTNSSVYSWMFKRAPGFFDVVAYTGTGAVKTVNHNLGVAPEMIILKARTQATARSWIVYQQSLGNTSLMYLQTADVVQTGATTFWNSTSPTNSVFTLGSSGSVNDSGYTYIAYLFASLPGISKVGSYTGNGSSQTINCGFSTGARFVLIKRTDSTGDWYVWDTARGIVSANDPHLSLNTTAAEVTTDDSVDPDATGFIVNQVAATNINVSSASYIYLAIA